ncbi:hypothetical protein ASG39_21850 [Rhizobium sp. Leaf371]|nr:hypothetical protein ASG39_21850 [Rhizobium sp. Leaf371]
MTPPFPATRWGSVFHGKQQAADVDRNDFVEVFLARIFQRTLWACNTCDVTQNVQLPELGDGHVDHRLDIVTFADVGRASHRALTKFGGEIGLFSADIRKHDTCSFLVKEPCRCRSDPGACARDKGDLTFHNSVHSSFSFSITREGAASSSQY